ncbi:hypothetical protein [Desertivirga arenae]|uniref:hypothetical protein n=1 Tax=Desertivirga arenae TaxID=2810309 RepID=UPI001A96F334|nr:hypothetical protein [Pedobacter sp. SYSU D00823]
MDIYTFLSLSKEEQANAIAATDCLSERQEALFKVKLYAMSDFYVEMFCTEGEGEVVKFKAFKSRRLLVPYLDNFMASVLA